MTESYHIAFVTLGFDPVRTSGMDIAGERVVHALLRAGHRVTVIALQTKEPSQPTTETVAHPHLAIYRVAAGKSDWIGYSWRAAQTLKSLQRRTAFDIVHFFDVHFAYAYHRPFVATVHQSFHQRLAYWESSQETPLKRLVRPLYYLAARYVAETPALHRAICLVADSHATRDDLITAYHIDPEQILLGRNFIDTDFFQPDPIAAQTLRTQLAIPTTDPIILFSGFITPRKGLSYLAEALQQVTPEPWILTTGRWSPAQKEIFDQMMGERASRVLHQGFVPDSQMPVLYSLADLYLSASLLEGFGLPLAEALACETPVVAATGGSVAEVVGPGGVITPARDSAALAAAVSDLLADAPRRQLMGRAGREYVQANFALTGMVNQLRPAYRRFFEVSKHF